MCIGRELNPGLPRGRREFYHWTTDAAWKFTFPGVKKLFKDCFIPTQWEKWSLTKIASPAGNWTRVSRVTGGDTHHYTTKDWAIISLKIYGFALKWLPVLDLIEILALIWYKNIKLKNIKKLVDIPKKYQDLGIQYSKNSIFINKIS